MINNFLRLELDLQSKRASKWERAWIFSKMRGRRERIAWLAEERASSRRATACALSRRPVSRFANSRDGYNQAIFPRFF